MQKRIFNLLLVLTMIISFVVPVKAESVNFIQTLSNQTVKVGYTEVYMDSKPAVPSSNLTVTIEGENVLGKSYETVLLDADNNKIASSKGTLDSNSKDVVLKIPGTTKDGECTVITTIDETEKSSSVVLLNNYNLGSTISTNVTGYTGNTWDLVDGIQWSMYTPKSNIPTVEKPAEFVFEYANEIDVRSLVISSTCGDAQGPKTGEILYWDDANQAWINILNNGSKTFNFNWVTGANCEILTYDFDQAYSTSKMMLRVQDGNTSWGNTNCIVEVQVWASKSASIEFEQTITDSIIETGYRTVYFTDETPKPSTPPSSFVEVNVEGEGLTNKEYTTVILDKSNQNLLEKKGTVTSDKMSIQLEIPGTFAAGEYIIKTIIENKEVSDKITVLNNINLGSSITFNSTGYSGKTTDLIDGIHYSMYTPVSNKPTASQPAEFTISYGGYVELYSLVVSSTYGKNQGPKTGEILYWSEANQEWVNILNSNGNKTFTFNWTSNGICELLPIDFGSSYITTKLMLRITDSNTTWENTNQIAEIQVWGRNLDDNVFNQKVDNSIVKVGYTKVYGESKPSTPPVSSVEVVIEGSGISGKEYTTALFDGSNNKVTHVTGTLTSDQLTVNLELPDSIESGKYTVRSNVGELVDSDEVIILNNVNIGSTITTNVTGYTGNTWDLVDSLQWGMYTPKSNKPTSNSPAEFVFEYGKLSNVYSVGVASTYGKDQGPKTGEILYWDIDEGKWINILNNGNKIFNFNWVINGVSELLTFNFDESYKTSKIKLRVTDSNTSWENTNSVVEVQAWGYGISELPSETINTNEGTYKEENNVLVVVKNTNKLKDTNVTLELVDALTLDSLSTPVSYDTTMKNGKLEYNFVVPNTVPLGTYKIKVSYDGYEAYTNEYRIILDQDVNIEDVSKYLNIALLNDYSKKVTTINDDKLDTSWTNNGSTTLLFEVNPENNKFTNIVLKNIKVYAQKDSITSFALKLVASTNYYRYSSANSGGRTNTLVQSSSLTWMSDAKGDYFVIDSGYLSFGNIYLLELKTNDTIKINEIEANGIYLKENLFSETKVTHNDKAIDASGMTDNIVNSYYKTNANNGEVYVFDFAPRTITANEIIYSGHYPLSQGVSKMKVEIWEDGAWKEAGVYEFDHKTDNEIREAKNMIFEEITTEKVRLTVVEANRVWSNSYLFTDINIIGTINESAQYIAETLDTQIVVNQGATQLPLQEVEGYEVSVATSSNENVLGLDGSVNALSTDTTVTVTLKVTNKNKPNDVGYTQEIEISVPRTKKDGNTLVSFEYDGNTIYNNPAMGWLQYYEYTTEDVEKYWEDMDKLYEKGLKTNILYIRNLWCWFEPEEGKYAWEDPNSQLSQLVDGARKRGLQIAFRVVLDGTDMWTAAVPDYVYEAGALGYKATRNDDSTALDPYINDPIFLEKLEKFVKAFAEEYNDDLDIAYIDGWGFGSWGEGHNVKYHTSFADNSKSMEENMNDAIEKIVKIYEKNFPDVLLGTMEGQPERIGTEKTDFVNNSNYYTNTLKEDYDWVVRKDTFGWMTQAIKDRLLNYFKKGTPIYAENCYHSFKIREYWYCEAGWPTLDSILQQVIKDALYVRANTLDARTVMDCDSWLLNDEENHADGEGLLDLFGVKGGYRFAVTTVETPTLLIAGRNASLTSAWRNYGVGMLPNNNEHWGQKYKVAYALLDKTTNEVIYQYNVASDEINPGNWLLEDGNNRYDTTFTVPTYLASGEYKLAVAIVNEKNDYKPEIDLAVSNATITDEGWYVINTVEVYNDADYTKVNEAIAAANALNKDLYSNFTAVEEAIAAVVDGKKINEQNEVDAMAKAIEDAVNALEYKPADYSAVEDILSKVPADLSKYTDKTVEALKAAINAVKEGLDITKQEQVDGYANAIKAAIEGLKVKTSTDTGDHSSAEMFAVTGLLSLCVLFLLKKKREEF